MSRKHVLVIYPLFRRAHSEIPIRTPPVPSVPEPEFVSRSDFSRTLPFVELDGSSPIHSPADRYHRVHLIDGMVNHIFETTLTVHVLLTCVNFQSITVLLQTIQIIL
jgi:hypothetical protein